MKREALVKIAKEMQKVMKLKPPIPSDETSKEALLSEIEEAAEEIKPKLDVFSDETVAGLKELGFWPEADGPVEEEEEEDDAPAPAKKGKKVVEDDDDEDEKPVKKGKKVVEEEEEEVPVKKGKKVVEDDDDEDEKPAPKKAAKKVVDDDDDEDDAPVAKKGKAAPAVPEVDFDELISAVKVTKKSTPAEKIETLSEIIEENPILAKFAKTKLTKANVDEIRLNMLAFLVKAEAAPAKKSAKGEKAPKEKKEKAFKGPGIIATIVSCVEKAGKKGISKEEILEVLVETFPDRDADSMKATINVQVPNRIKKERFDVVTLEGGRYAKRG